MIDSHVETIVVVALGWRRYKVLKGHGAIGQGIKRGDCPAEWIDEEIGNCAVLKWQASKRICRYTEKTLREVAGTFLSRWYIRHSSNAFARTSSLVVSKEKCSVTFDRSTDRPAKLVADVLWFWFSARSKEIARVHRGVS